MCTLLFRFFTRRSALNTVHQNLLVETTVRENCFRANLILTRELEEGMYRICIRGKNLVIRLDGMTGKRERIRRRKGWKNGRGWNKRKTG